MSFCFYFTPHGGEGLPPDPSCFETLGFFQKDDSSCPEVCLEWGLALSWLLDTWIWGKEPSDHVLPTHSHFFFFLIYIYILLKCDRLQCFTCTARWFSYTYTHILFQIIFHYRLWQGIDYSSLCYTVKLCCTSILF